MSSETLLAIDGETRAEDQAEAAAARDVLGTATDAEAREIQGERPPVKRYPWELTFAVGGETYGPWLATAVDESEAIQRTVSSDERVAKLYRRHTRGLWNVRRTG
ncbi:hypothetical protein [Botrimarina sp.]|uniref:hypothetical protein n=1 Tax=Botrimarina sp. TaxID=2795802 RepID=UPI0032EECF9C